MNMGKIVNALKNGYLRFEPGRKEPEVQTIQDFQIAWVF
jgi:hypothetical protein